MRTLSLKALLALPVVLVVAAATGCSSSSGAADGGNTFGGGGGDGGVTYRDSGVAKKSDSGGGARDSATAHDAPQTTTHDSSTPGVDAPQVDAPAPIGPTEAGPVDSGSPCGTAALTGNPVGQQQTTAPAPVPSGGAIIAGTYLLRSSVFYPDSADASFGTTSLEAQGTLILGLTTFSWAQALGNVDAGVGAVSLSGGTWAASGTTVTFTAVCPAASVTTYSFDAFSRTLALIQGQNEYDYQLQP